MKKQIPFKGLCTALVTPMKEGKVDYFALEKLISFQIEAGVDGVLLLGTTGEASTLTPAEKREIAKMGRALTKGKTKYILGCGANSTKEALQLCQNAGLMHTGRNDLNSLAANIKRLKFQQKFGAVCPRKNFHFPLDAVRADDLACF